MFVSEIEKLSHLTPGGPRKENAWLDLLPPYCIRAQKFLQVLFQIHLLSDSENRAHCAGPTHGERRLPARTGRQYPPVRFYFAAATPDAPDHSFILAVFAAARVRESGEFRSLMGRAAAPTGNVIDFSRGPLSPILTREKSYGSSGGIEDDPWRLR